MRRFMVHLFAWGIGIVGLISSFGPLCRSLPAGAAEPPAKRPTEAVPSIEEALAQAGSNRAELERALKSVPAAERSGMEFIVRHMPDADRKTLSADFLVKNHVLAYKARKQFPWAESVPEAVFLNNVLPYANVDEKRDPWRQEFYDLSAPIVKDCKSASEAVHKLNSELFKKIGVKYAPQRRAPNLSPKESMAQGNASCTGLSIILSDACRAVGIPTRLAGTPNWYDKRGNHTWLEVWDRDWHFTGACEPDPAGLDRGWFVGDAAKAIKDNPEHAIYAVDFQRGAGHYPLVWDRRNTSVPGVNVTDRYAKPQPPKSAAYRLLVRVVDADRKRTAVEVVVTAPGATDFKKTGKSRGEQADLNDVLEFDLPADGVFVVVVGNESRTVKSGKAGEKQMVEFVLPRK